MKKYRQILATRSQEQVFEYLKLGKENFTVEFQKERIFKLLQCPMERDSI